MIKILGKDARFIVKCPLYARINTERFKFQDLNICPNILRVDTDVLGIEIALLYRRTVAPFSLNHAFLLRKLIHVIVKKENICISRS